MVLHDCRPMPRYVVLFTVNAATVSGPPINFSGTVQYCTISSGCCKQVRCIAVKVQLGRIPSNKLTVISVQKNQMDLKSWPCLKPQVGQIGTPK